MPSRSVAADGVICASPDANSGVLPAITSGRPALSRKTSASSRSGLTSCAAAALSISWRHSAVRFALAITPPGLSAYSTWEVPSAALDSNSARRLGDQAKGSSFPAAVAASWATAVAASTGSSSPRSSRNANVPAAMKAAMAVAKVTRERLISGDGRDSRDRSGQLGHRGLPLSQRDPSLQSADGRISRAGGRACGGRAHRRGRTPPPPARAPPHEAGVPRPPPPSRSRPPGRSRCGD